MEKQIGKIFENHQTAEFCKKGSVLTKFGPHRSHRRDLFFEKFSNERRRHRGIVVVIVAVVVAVVVVGRFGVACIKGTSLPYCTALIKTWNHLNRG